MGKNSVSCEEEELRTEIKDAEKLHGHLGPFLVIGVRMGIVAKKIGKGSRLRATVKVPLLTPFSCVIDGIQSTTKCTIGNQKLKTENSPKDMTARFNLQDQNKIVAIRVNLLTVEELTNKISKHASMEELAWKVAKMPESQLFTIETQ